MDIEQLWNRISNRKKVDEITGCWLFTGSLDPVSRYGRIIMPDNKYMHVHRISCAFHHGLDLNDRKQFACHKVICPNRHCFNPDHLYKGDNKSNQLDFVNNLCKKGHDLSIDGNVRIYFNKAKGRTQRLCRVCLNEVARLAYHRNKKSNENLSKVV